MKSEMICIVCRRFLKNPVSLPCQCCVCNEHLQGNNSTSFHCQTCDQEFQMPQAGFAINKIAANILAKELHLNDEEKLLKKCATDLIQRLEQLQEEFKSKQSDLERLSYDHFAEIRRNIDIQREELKSKMDEIAIKLINMTNQKEAIYKLKVKEVNEHPSMISNQTLLDEFRNPDLLVREIKGKLDEQKSKIAEFQAKIAALDSLSQNIKSIEFKAHPEFRKESFVTLKQSNQRLISCSLDKTIKVWDLEDYECISTLEG